MVFFKKQHANKKLGELELPPLPPLPEKEKTTAKEEPPEKPLIFPEPKEIKEEIELPPMPKLEPERIKEEIAPEQMPSMLPELGPPIKEVAKPLPELEIPKQEPFFKEEQLVIKPEKKEIISLIKPKERVTKPKAMFVESDMYRQMLNSLNSVESRIRESDDIIKNLNEIKNVKDKEFEKWRLQLEELQRRIMLVDKTLA